MTDTTTRDTFVDIWVGDTRVRYRQDPAHCPHTDDNMCPSCAGFTRNEAAAMRRFLGGAR